MNCGLSSGIHGQAWQNLSSILSIMVLTRTERDEFNIHSFDFHLTHKTHRIIWNKIRAWYLLYNWIFLFVDSLFKICVYAKEKNCSNGGGGGGGRYKLLSQLHYGALHTVTPTMSFLAQRTLIIFLPFVQNPCGGVPATSVAETTGSWISRARSGRVPNPKAIATRPLRTLPLPRKSFAAVQWSGVPLRTIKTIK